MVFLDHVQNLHIRAEKTHKDFGAHCMKYVNFVHDPEKQYRSTVPAVRPLSTGLQVTEHVLRASGVGASGVYEMCRRIFSTTDALEPSMQTRELHRWFAHPWFTRCAHASYYSCILPYFFEITGTCRSSDL